MRLLFTTFVLSLFLIGCQSSKLEQGGAYAPTMTNVVDGATNVVAVSAPDLGFFYVESAFELAHSAIITVGNAELRNRQLLWGLNPRIKLTLDRLRPQVNEAVLAYAKARQAYLANRTPAGLTDLQTALSRVKELAAAFEASLPKQ